MFKLFSIALLIALSFQENSATILPNDEVLSLLYSPANSVNIPASPKISEQWEQHIKDFVYLIDIDKVVAVALEYLTDPEVLHFVTFILSNDFKNLVWEFESMTEFKEAFKFLADKGYDVGSVMELINTALDLDPFEKPNVKIAMGRKGVTGLIEDLIAVLPIEELKKIFEHKLETSPEVAHLFETIMSPEFMDIMKRMAKNSQFLRFQEILEGYGFDFEHLCRLAKDIFGKYYQGVFCE